MIFNYDKENGTFNNSKNLSDVKQSIIDFFTKKQDIKKNYVLTDKDNDFFKRFKETFSSDQISGSNEKVAYAKQLVDQYADQKQGIYDLIEAKGLLGVTEANLADAQSTTIQGMTKFQYVAKSAVTAVKSFVGTLGNMAIAMAASWAIGKAIEGIDYLIHYDENIIKAGQEAKDSIDSTFKSFEEGKQSIMDLGSSFDNQTEQIKNTGDAIDQVAEKYVDLRKGVNQNTNENVSLSTDEYQQYIDLSSKLASQFPGLVAGYDSQGNAVLNLASNADKAADSIRNLYEAQVSSANVDMGKNLQATYDGVVTQTSQYAEDIQKKRDELAQLDIDISENKRSILTYGSNNFEVQNLYGDKENVITDVLKENGLYKENTGDDGSIWNFYAEGLADKSEQEIDRMNEQITAGMESYYLTLESQRSQLQSEINSYDLMIEDQWRSMAQSLGNYLQTSKSFNELDDSLQSAFLANISNLDLTALNDPDGEYKGQVLDFLYGEFLGPMSQFSTDVQESLAKALQIDPSKLTIDEYRSQVDEAFKDAFGNDTEEKKELQERFKNAYGIDSSIEDMEDNASRLKEAYADFPNASDFIDQMQTGDLSIAAQLIDNGSVDIKKGTDGLVSAIERYKKTVAESTDGPILSSILGDSDNEISSSIDSLQSDISSLSDTLIKLKTGEFKDSDLTDIIQQFPQLASGTDDLQKSISNLKVSKVTDSIKKIDDAMVGASKEEMEYAKALKGSILKEADLSDIDAATAKQEIEKLFKNAYSSAPQTVAENMAKGFINSYSSYMTSDTGAQAMLKAVEQNIGNITSTGFDWGKEIKNFLPTTADFINNETIQSQLTDYQDKYQSLYQAQKDLKNGLMTGSTRKTFLDKFPDLAKYAGNTETLSSAIDDLMDSMDSDVTNQFTDAIKALQDAGQYADASALQSYVEAVLDGAHDIEGAYQKIAGLKIPTPQYAKLKEALESSNEGDLYNELLSQYKTAKEAWEKGEVGTDDFKSFASIISPTGVSDAVNFGENQAMFERYFQDTSTGVENFLEDLQKLDLASNESGHWTSTLGNNLDEMRDAAQRLNIGFEPFMMMFGRLEDYGATTDFFTTEEDGQQHLSDLYQQIAEKKQKLAEIKADPDLAGDQSAIDSLNKDLDELYARVENTKTGIEELPDKATYYEAKNLEQAKSVITQMQDEINQAAAEGNDELVKILEKTRDQYLKENGYILKEQPQGQTQQGTIENPLAREFTNPTKFGDYETVIKKIQNATDEQTSSLEENLKVLSQYSESQLSGINLSDGQYDAGFEDAEQALDNLSSTFGLTKDQAVQLAAVLSDMGLIKATPKVDLTTVQDQIDNAKDELQDSNITVDLDFDISTSSKEELQKKSQEIQEELNNNTSLSTSEKTTLQGVKDSVDNQVVTLTVQEKVEKDGDVDELLAMDDQTLAATLDLDVNNESQLKTARDDLQYIKDNQDAQVDMTVKLDESQFKQLLGDKDQASINLTANDKEAKEKINETKEYANKSKGTIKIDGNSYSAISKADSAVKFINGMTGTIKIDANIDSMTSKISSELAKPRTIDISANVHTNVRGAVKGAAASASGSMIRVAHTDGTAYNVLNYSPAYANGNVALNGDENALVNELGNESIVRNGKWMLIPGGAHFENLKKGDIIFNAQQTSELINSGHVTSGGGHARAYANGTVGAYAGGNSGVYLNWDKNRTQVGNQSTSSPSNSTITDKNTISVKKNTDTVNDNTEKVKKSTKVYNWVEIRIKHWSDQVQKIADKITDYIKKSLKTSLLKQQIRKMNYEIGSNQKGAKTYMKKANSIANEYTYYNSDGEEIKTNVPKKYQKLVQKGAYRIEDMDTSTDEGKALAEAIDQYKTYYDKAQDCKQAVVDLKKEQMELFEQWANMPTETAEQALERLQNGFNGLNATQSRLSAVQTGGSTQKAIADAATASYESAQVVTEKAQSNLDTATAKADKATTAVNRKKKALLKSKGLTNEQKKAIKSGKTIDTSKITNKTTKKRAEEYNSAVKNKKKADSKKKTAQTKFNTANKNSSSLKTDAEAAIVGYQEGNELSYMDSLTDQNVTQTKQAANINNKAWEETKKNLNAQEKAKKQADDKVSKKAKAIKKKFGSKLSDNQKKKLAAGKEINVDNIKDKSLKKALTTYNKYVTTAAETEQKLNIVTDAESTAAANAAESQTEAAKATVEAIQSKFDNAKTYYEGLLGYQEKYNEMEEANIDLYNAHGNYERSSDYEIKISNTESLRNIAQDKVDELEKRFQEGVDNGTIVEGSQEWINMKSEIVEAKKAVTDYETSIENLKQQQIGVYYEEQFDRAIEKIDQFKDRIDILNEIISDDMKVDKNTGLLTELGATSVMLNRNQFSANQKEIQKLLEKENDVKKRYANGEDMSSEFGEKTYDEYIKDIQSKYNSLISSNSSLQNDMLSLVKNQAQAELDALNKVISKRKEALSAKKDYYDYDKTLKDKTKDIQILERQAAALQGSTNAEDKARLAKIQEQLADAREDLSDTMTDHAFSMQSDALDKLSSDMSDDFDKWSNDISSNVEKMSKAINEAVSNSALSNAQVLNNLSTILKNVGLTDEQVSSTLSGLTGYASGTDYVPKSGMYRVNENGMESVLSRKYGTLTFLNQGDKVFTADFTKRLIDNAGIATQSSQPQFGEMYKELMNAITNTNNQSFGDMTVNFYIDGAKDIDALKTEIYGTMKQVLRDHDKKQVRDFKSLR